MQALQFSLALFASICLPLKIETRNHGRSHSLDPLSEEEIRATVKIIDRERPGNWMYSAITLKEPAKPTLLPYFLNDTVPDESAIPRRSFVILHARRANKTFEAVVNLSKDKVESWIEIPFYAAPHLMDEIAWLVEKIVRENETVQEHCRRLGWTDMNLVVPEVWPIGYVKDKPEFIGRRIYQAFVFGKNFEGDNQNAHPFDILVVVDVMERKVIAIEDVPTHDDCDGRNRAGNVVPLQSANYEPELRDPGGFREDMKPISVLQNGTSFSLIGNELRWNKFKMRIGFNYREGLVLHHVSVNDSGRVRPIFYRLSLVEMFIPYADPRPPYHRKQMLDAGEGGIGFMANTLTEKDCIGNVRFIDAVLHNEIGEPKIIPRVVCVREEDGGILWKHTDSHTRKTVVVRSQRLAISFGATFGHYDYLYTWNFQMDGAIEFEVKLTGILNVHMLAQGATPIGHGTVVSPSINAQYHQHFFSLRVDPDIDGSPNTVVMSDVVPGPEKPGSPEDPFGLAFTTRRTVLKTASEARSNVDSRKSRVWLMTNPSVKHPVSKEAVAWKLIPWASPPMFTQKDTPMHSRVAWVDYNTWVLPFREEQVHSAGLYLNSSGLPEWVARDPDAKTENVDIVLWHNFGVTHIPRVEDWPVMPVETCRIYLRPVNFFSENPSMDILPFSSKP